MNEAFEVGTTVRLKSGGPLMTVIQLVPVQNALTRVVCAWHDKQHHLQQSVLPITAVDHIEKEKADP